MVSVYAALLALAADPAAVAQKVPEPYPASALHTPPAWFEDVASQAGIKVLNINGGVTSKRYILEATGSGVAILDYDGDGYPDIFLVNGAYLHAEGGKDQPTSHLFHNNHDGTFTDVTANSGLTDTAWGQGACVGDYDNDGLPDLYVTGYGKNRLYHNQGHGHFREVAEQAGVAGTGKEWGTGCAFVDYDRDGKLDIAIANYVHFDIKDVPEPGKAPGCIWKGVPVMCGPRGLEYAPNTLYHNLGNGKFEDVSVKSGFTKTTGHYCFSVSTLDADEDGWPDIYMACDSTPAILYHNNHDGTFTDRAADAGVAFNEDGREQAGMGSTIGDYDGDGHLDIFKTNFSDDTATLYHAHGDGTYDDVTYPAGLGINTDKLGWGAMFIDIDNDGWPDILSANGHVYPEVDSSHLGSDYREPRLLYHNLGNGKFADITKTSGPGITTPASARGLAVADLWNDGRQEVVINDVSSLPMLLVNFAPNSNHWIGLALTGAKSNRSAIGARVTVRGTAAGKERVWVNEVRSGSSYNSSSDMRLHFGLGPSPILSEVEVSWPSGLTEIFPAPPIDRISSLTEGAGKPLSGKAAK
ncbi:MAG TPA: CRTAC1 family protein [Acidobacteriaceae bacterium]|nr:CRTAC1 family protein [Acidobacteriaceae bacterium]